MGTTERREREARQRRQDILDAARKVFWQRGYAGATMPQIASEAELAPGTLYLYFPGKDVLYVELLVEGYDLLLPRLEKQALRTAPPADLARGLVEAFFGFAREYPEYFNIIFYVLQRDSDECWRKDFPQKQMERLKAQEAACKQVAASVLDRIHFDSPAGRTLTVDVIWSMLAGVVFYFRNDETFDTAAEEARELILRAIFGDVDKA
jgi:AcrR family transcriptional regulator